MLSVGVFLIFFVLLYVALILKKRLGNPGADPVEETECTSSTYKFKRIDCVQGILHVGNKSIRTYDSGYLNVGDVALDLCYSGKRLEVLDITFKDQSLFAYSPFNYARSEKVNYAVEVLRQTVNQGTLSKEIVSEVQSILLEIEAMNEYISAGNIYQLDDCDYAWAE